MGTSIDQLRDDPDLPPECRGLLDAWLDWRGAGLVPTRKEVRPERLRGLMAAVSIFELVDDARILLRLESSTLRDWTEDSLRGADILDITPAGQRAARLERYRQAAHRPCGMYSRQQILVGTGQPIETASLLLPIAPKEGATPVLFYVAHCAVGEVPRIDEFSTPASPLAHAFSYVDIGAGLPDRPG